MGYSAGGPNASDFKFDYNLNYKVPEIIHTYSNNRPTLVVCWSILWNITSLYEFIHHLYFSEVRKSLLL